MVLELTQFANLKDVLDDYALYKTKYAYLYSMPDTDKKNPYTFEEVQTITDNDPDFIYYVDSTLTANGKNITKIPVKDKTQMLYVPDSLEHELISKLESRNLFLRNYMKTSMELQDKNLNIRTAEKDSLLIFKSNSHYKINLSLPGAEKSN